MLTLSSTMTEAYKVDMDVETFYDGYLAAIMVEEGGVAIVGFAIALLAEKEDEIEQAKSKAEVVRENASTTKVPNPERIREEPDVGEKQGNNQNYKSFWRQRERSVGERERESWREGRRVWRKGWDKESGRRRDAERGTINHHLLLLGLLPLPRLCDFQIWKSFIT